jgi:hypothetical protein
VGTRKRCPRLELRAPASHVGSDREHSEVLGNVPLGHDGWFVVSTFWVSARSRRTDPMVVGLAGSLKKCRVPVEAIYAMAGGLVLDLIENQSSAVQAGRSL